MGAVLPRRGTRGTVPSQATSSEHAKPCALKGASTVLWGGGGETPRPLPNKKTSHHTSHPSYMSYFPLKSHQPQWQFLAPAGQSGPPGSPACPISAPSCSDTCDGPRRIAVRPDPARSGSRHIRCLRPRCSAPSSIVAPAPDRTARRPCESLGEMLGLAGIPGIQNNEELVAAIAADHAPAIDLVRKICAQVAEYLVALLMPEVVVDQA